MKSFKDFKLNLDEAAPQQQPQNPAAQKRQQQIQAAKQQKTNRNLINAKVRATGSVLRTVGLNASRVAAGFNKLNDIQQQNPNLRPTAVYSKLGSYQVPVSQAQNEIPSDPILNPNVPLSTIRTLSANLLRNKRLMVNVQRKAEMDAAKAAKQAEMKAYQKQRADQMKAAKQGNQVQEEAVVESSEEFNPPALLTLRRIGVRNFPDGRRVAMYTNPQLGLVFSIPYAGKGQTPGEIIPTVQAQGIKEDLDKTSPPEGTPVKVIGNVQYSGKKGRLVSSNKDGTFHVVEIGGKPYSFHGANLILAEEVDDEDKGEYDYEGDMAISQLKSIISNSMKLKDMLEPDTNLPEWVQAKITLAEDYVVTAANYMEGQDDNKGAGDELDESAASFIAHMKAAMKAKDEEIKARHLLKAKDARLSMTNAEIAKYKDLLNQHREMMSEEVEELDEAQNVRIVGKKKLIRVRVRAGKIQRRKVVSAVKGYKVVGGQVKRESAKERLDRKRGARKAKIKRRAKLARSLIKRKRSLRKRASMGL